MSPLSVSCPDCGAPPETACYVSGGSGGFDPGDTHANRSDRAALESGTCRLCGGALHRLNGKRWHADRSDTCPPLPDPHLDWNAYALRLQDGVAPGDPGDDNYLPPRGLVDGGAVDTPTVCPECGNGKCRNCDHRAMDPFTDEIVACGCELAGHELELP